MSTQDSEGTKRDSFGPIFNPARHDVEREEEILAERVTRGSRIVLHEYNKLEIQRANLQNIISRRQDDLDRQKTVNASNFAPKLVKRRLQQEKAGKPRGVMKAVDSNRSDLLIILVLAPTDSHDDAVSTCFILGLDVVDDQGRLYDNICEIQETEKDTFQNLSHKIAHEIKTRETESEFSSLMVIRNGMFVHTRRVEEMLLEDTTYAKDDKKLQAVLDKVIYYLPAIAAPDAPSSPHDELSRIASAMDRDRRNLPEPEFARHKRDKNSPNHNAPLVVALNDEQKKRFDEWKASGKRMQRPTTANLLDRAVILTVRGQSEQQAKTAFLKDHTWALCRGRFHGLMDVKTRPQNESSSNIALAQQIIRLNPESYRNLYVIDGKKALDGSAVDKLLRSSLAGADIADGKREQIVRKVIAPKATPPVDKKAIPSSELAKPRGKTQMSQVSSQTSSKKRKKKSEVLPEEEGDEEDTSPEKKPNHRRSKAKPTSKAARKPPAARRAWYDDSSEEDEEMEEPSAPKKSTKPSAAARPKRQATSAPVNYRVDDDGSDGISEESDAVIVMDQNVVDDNDDSDIEFVRKSSRGGPVKKGKGPRAWYDDSSEEDEEMEEPSAPKKSTKPSAAARPKHDGSDGASEESAALIVMDQDVVDDNSDIEVAAKKSTSTPAVSSRLMKRNAALGVDNAAGQSTSRNATNLSKRRGASKKPRVLFTGVSVTDKEKQMVKAISGTLLENLEDAATATHVVAADDETPLRRTPKLMIGICYTSNIVNLNWLIQSAKERTAVSCEDYLLLDDKKFEKQHGVLLCRDALARGEALRKQGKKLFGGYLVYVCKGVAGCKAPPAKELQLIVEGAGGEWMKSVSRIKKEDAKRTLIITSHPPEKAQLSPGDVEKAIKAGARHVTVCSFFDSITGQQIVWNQETKSPLQVSPNEEENPRNAPAVTASDPKKKKMHSEGLDSPRRLFEEK